MRSPSTKLLEQLADLRLCSPRELAGCEAQVARLCGDLPDFDSVWLDAMVQRRLLTAWQSEQLQRTGGDSLVVGEFACLQQVGRNSFLAIHRHRCQPVFLHRLVSPATHKPAVESPVNTQNACAEARSSSVPRLTELIGTLSSDPAMQAAPPSLVLPSAVIQQNPETVPQGTSRQEWVVNPWAAGWSLEELLNRRGRFPWQAVAEIGRELLIALAWLESRRLLHGDLVLRNVRLTPVGRVALTGAFVRRHLSPYPMLSDQLTLRDCEGVAPEQINAVRSTDVRSELFALGCVLWQCLSCRPVVLNADPVARLMKLREQDVPDIRNFVPDCPDWMAHTLQSLTRRSPELRPNSVAEVLKLWRSAAGSGTGHCRAMVRGMPDASRRYRLPIRVRSVAAWPTVPLPETADHGPTNCRPSRQMLITNRTRRSVISIAAVMIAGVATLLASGILPQTLRFGRTSTHPLTDTVVADSVTPSDRALLKPHAGTESSDPQQASAVSQSEWLWPLPTVNGDGTIPLVAGRHYLASSLKRTGLLQIETQTNDSPVSSGVRSGAASTSVPLPVSIPLAIIHVPQGEHWSVTADQVILRGIQLQSINPRDVDRFRRVASGAASEMSPSGTNQPGLSGSQAGLLTAHTRLLVMEQCWLTTQGLNQDWACVSWLGSSAHAAVDNSAASVRSEILMKDVVLQGTGYGLRLAHPSDSLQFDNVLFRTAVSALRCDIGSPHSDPSPQAQQLRLEIHRLTQRGGSSFLDVVVRSLTVPAVQLTISGGESVLAPDTALIRLACPVDWPGHNLQAHFQLPRTGNAVVVPPHVKPGLRFDQQLHALVELSDQQMMTDSLLMAEPQFRTSMDSATAGNSTDDFETAVTSALVDFEGPKLTTEMPGIDPSRLPVVQPALFTR